MTYGFFPFPVVLRIPRRLRYAGLGAAPDVPGTLAGCGHRGKRIFDQQNVPNVQQPEDSDIAAVRVPGLCCLSLHLDCRLLDALDRLSYAVHRYVGVRLRLRWL